MSRSFHAAFSTLATMQKSRVKDSFIIRVEITSRGQVIHLQNLKQQEQLEFDSWLELCRYLRISTTFALSSTDKTDKAGISEADNTSFQ